MYTVDGWIKKLEPLLEKEGINKEKLKELAEVFRMLNFSPKNAVAWSFYFLSNKNKKEVCILTRSYIGMGDLKRRIKNLINA